MDSLQWMGAVRVQTADKNITSNTTPVYPWTSYEKLQILLSPEIRKGICSDQGPFLSVHKILIWEDNSETTFSLQEVLLDYGHVF